MISFISAVQICIYGSMKLKDAPFFISSLNMLLSDVDIHSFCFLLRDCLLIAGLLCYEDDGD